jgi:hypothetical protein
VLSYYVAFCLSDDIKFIYAHAWVGLNKFVLIFEIRPTVQDLMKYHRKCNRSRNETSIPYKWTTPVVEKKFKSKQVCS